MKILHPVPGTGCRQWDYETGCDLDVPRLLVAVTSSYDVSPVKCKYQRNNFCTQPVTQQAKQTRQNGPRASLRLFSIRHGQPCMYQSEDSFSLVCVTFTSTKFDLLEFQSAKSYFAKRICVHHLLFLDVLYMFHRVLHTTM